MEIKSKKPRTSSRPEGYVPARINIPLELTKKQEQYCFKASQVTRFVYNLCVSVERFCFKNRLKQPSWMDLRKEIDAVKAEDYPWVKEVCAQVTLGAVRNFGIAMDRAYLKISRFPAYKKRKTTNSGSFLAGSGVHVIKYLGKRRIKIPYLGSTRMSRVLPSGLIPYEAKILFRNGQWILSLACWKDISSYKKNDNQVPKVAGVDVGIQPLAFESDGTATINIKPYNQALKNLKKWQRRQDRRVKGSNGWWKAQNRLNKLNRRILRNNLHHQLSNSINKKYDVIGLETLNVAGMDKLRYQAKAIHDSAIGGLLTKIKYKADWYGNEIVQADRFYPSSKLCSSCGFKNTELKREKDWICVNCNTDHQRDFNASLNLETYALKNSKKIQLTGDYTLGSEGPEVTPLDREALAGNSKILSETILDEGGIRKFSDKTKQPEMCIA